MCLTLAALIIQKCKIQFSASSLYLWRAARARTEQWLERKKLDFVPPTHPHPASPSPATGLDTGLSALPSTPFLLPLDRDGTMKSTASESMPPHSPKHSCSLLDEGQTAGLFSSNESVFFLLFCFFTHHLRALKSQLESPRKHGETAVSATLKSIDEFKDDKKSLAG